MKRLLPILTLALLGAAVTASAGNFYYDYYLSHSNTPVTPHSTPEIDGKTYSNEYDTFTYGTITSFEKDANGKVAVSMDNTFTAHRESNWSTELDGADPNNFFRIEIGKDNTEKVELFLTDYAKSLYSDDTTYHSDSNAIFRETYDGEGNLAKRAIVEYGYRTLELKDGKYVAGGTQKFSTVIADDEGSIEIDGKNYRLNEENVTKIDEIAKLSVGNPPTARYQYSLGTFDPGTIIEVYMKDSAGNEVYSFSSYVNGEYKPFDNNAPNLDAEGQYLDANQGGFSDGGYVVGSTEVDGLLDAYYFVEAKSKPYEDYRLYTDFDKNRYYTAPEKAMPLSQLIPTNGLGVAFGIYAYATGETVMGKPLPGGLQIALIAGLFGLGFCYVRRRKAIVG